jgi:hypothetical protein
MRKYFATGTHVRATEFVRRRVKVSKFKLTLPQAQMNERVTEAAGTSGGICKCVISRAEMV